MDAQTLALQPKKKRKKREKQNKTKNHDSIKSGPTDDHVLKIIGSEFKRSSRLTYEVDDEAAIGEAIEPGLVTEGEAGAVGRVQAAGAWKSRLRIPSV